MSLHSFFISFLSFFFSSRIFVCNVSRLFFLSCQNYLPNIYFFIYQENEIKGSVFFMKQLGIFTRFSVARSAISIEQSSFFIRYF